MKHIFGTLQGFMGELYGPFMTFIQIVGIIILAVVVAKLGSMIIRKAFEKQKDFKYRLGNNKLDTMATLMVSVFRYSVYIIAVVTILANQFKMSSILAAAGIGGVAIGFGAQSLIKDVISGFFIVMEDQYIVGDLITIDTMNGVVEEMELRVTKIRNFNGDLYIIPNGEIKKVTNHTRGNKAAIVDIPVAYGTDIDKALMAAGRVCELISKEKDSFIEAPKVLGITEFGKENLNLRILAKTKPNGQWELERKIRRLIKEEFSRERLEFSPKEKVSL